MAHLADVQVAFFDRLTDDELRTLDKVFARLLGDQLTGEQPPGQRQKSGVAGRPA